MFLSKYIIEQCDKFSALHPHTKLKSIKVFVKKKLTPMLAARSIHNIQTFFCQILTVICFMKHQSRIWIYFPDSATRRLFLLIIYLGHLQCLYYFFMHKLRHNQKSIFNTEERTGIVYPQSSIDLVLQLRQLAVLPWCYNAVRFQFYCYCVQLHRVALHLF